MTLKELYNTRLYDFNTSYGKISPVVFENGGFRNLKKDESPNDVEWYDNKQLQELLEAVLTKGGDIDIHSYEKGLEIISEDKKCVKHLYKNFVDIHFNKDVIKLKNKTQISDVPKYIKLFEDMFIKSARNREDKLGYDKVDIVDKRGDNYYWTNGYIAIEIQDPVYVKDLGDYLRDSVGPDMGQIFRRYIEDSRKIKTIKCSKKVISKSINLNIKEHSKMLGPAVAVIDDNYGVSSKALKKLISLIDDKDFNVDLYPEGVYYQKIVNDKIAIRAFVVKSKTAPDTGKVLVS